MTYRPQLISFWRKRIKQRCNILVILKVRPHSLYCYPSDQNIMTNLRWCMQWHQLFLCRIPKLHWFVLSFHSYRLFGFVIFLNFYLYFLIILLFEGISNNLLCFLFEESKKFTWYKLFCNGKMDANFCRRGNLQRFNANTISLQKQSFYANGLWFRSIE